MSQDKGAPLPDHFKTNERRRDEFYLEKKPNLCAAALQARCHILGACDHFCHQVAVKTLF